MAITIDIPNTEVIMTTGQVAVTCQALVNALREFEDDFQMMSNTAIIDAEGKVNIGGSTFTEIVLKLLNPWTLRFVDEATQHTEVTGGTIVALDAVGAKRPPTTNPSLVINQSISGTLVETGVSGLTPTESAALLNIETDVDAVATDQATINTNIGTINTNIATINTTLGTIQGDISTINSSITTIDGNIVTILSNTTSAFQKNTAFSGFTFTMVDVTGQPATGLSVTGTRRIDTGSFSALANSISEINASGVYVVDLAASDLNGDVITLKFTATGAIGRVITIVTTG